MRKVVLSVEDNPGDVRPTRDAFRDAAPGSIGPHVAIDGVEVMAFLRREGVHAIAPRPDFILLDLDVPRMDDREVVTLIKEYDSSKSIATLILTTSDADEDILKSHQLRANCYLSNRVRLDASNRLAKTVDDLWLTTVKPPQLE